MITILEVIKKSSEFLLSKGIESSRFNAETLVGHALNLPRMKLYMQFERILSESELELVRPIIRRRAQGEPLQYITGSVDFGGEKFKVDKRALIPRPETEYLIELVQKRLEGKAVSNILDLGTGTGAIALTLAKIYPTSHVVAVDLSELALDLAKENADNLGMADRVTFTKSSWFNSISKLTKFDVIISNPPYLSEKQLESTPIEVKGFEPHTALVSKDNGLSDIIIILENFKEYINAGGLLALETGDTQHQRILSIASDRRLAPAESVKDLTGRDRFIFIQN